MAEPHRETAQLRSIRVPVPEDAPRYFQTATLLLDERFLITSWVEGRAANRIGVLDLGTGEWRVAAGVRGMLRDGLAGADDRALLLTDHGLTELDLATLQITRKLTAKIGKHNDVLRHDAPGVVAVGSSSATMESLVALDTLTVVQRRRRRPGSSPVMAPESTVEPTADERRAGLARVLARSPELLVAATDERAPAPQRLLVVSAADLSVLATADFPDGLSDAYLVRDGVIAAAPDVGRIRDLTAIPQLRPYAEDPGAPPLGRLVPAADASAAALLRQRARRNPPRLVIRDRRLEPGAELADVEASRVTLENCVAGRASDPLDRPRISRVRVKDLELQPSSLSGALLEDVTVDGLRAPYGSGFVFGCEFRRVVITGRVRGLILNPMLHDPDPAVEARYARRYRERLEDPEWMLDLTGATGDLTIRGYPSRFIRRNPDLQVVVTAEAAATLDWRSIDAGRSALWVSIDELARSDWEDVALIANPHGSHADDDLRYIRELRARGIAQPD